MSDGVEELFQLAANGDERSIKRRYAGLLKQTRPDEDPEGFQRLHAAYEQALAMCRHASPRPHRDAGHVERPAGADGDARPASAIPRGENPPLPRTAQTITPGDADDGPVDPTPWDASEQLLALVPTTTAGEYGKRLQQVALHWSMHTRSATAHCLLHRLHDEAMAMPRDHFDVLAGAMGWLDVLAGVDHTTLLQLRERAHGQWLLQPEQHRQLQTLLTEDGARLGERPLRAVLASVRVPQPRWRNLATALRPKQVRPRLRLLHLLGYIPGHPPHGVDPEQAAFWEACGDPHSRTALQLSLLRTALAALTAIPLLLGYLLAIEVISGADVPLRAAMMCGAVALGWAGWQVYGRLLDWQCLPEREHTAWPWMRRLALPALALGWTALALVALQGDSMLAAVAIWTGTTLIMRIGALRLAMRRGRSLEIGTFGGMLLFGAIVMIFPALLLGVIFWAIDAWNHRAWWSR